MGGRESGCCVDSGESTELTYLIDGIDGVHPFVYVPNFFLLLAHYFFIHPLNNKYKTNTLKNTSHICTFKINLIFTPVNYKKYQKLLFKTLHYFNTM